MKAKPVLAIILSIIIGFVIGFMVNAQLVRKKVDNMVKLGMEDGFRHRVIYMIHPDEDQMKEINPIIDKYARINAELTRDFGGQLKNQLNAFYDELSPYLTPEQKERLKQIEHHRRQMMHEKLRNGKFKSKPDQHGPGMDLPRCDVRHNPFWKDMELDSATATQIQELYNHFYQQRDSLKNHFEETQDMKEEMMKIKMERNMAIMQLLNDDQKEKFRQDQLP